MWRRTIAPVANGGIPKKKLSIWLNEKEPWKRRKRGKRTLAKIADSGNRREFSTGAVRDMSDDKGDMVSLPASAILRLSKHYQNGAKKYGRWNYTKGIPVSSFLDSAFRHLYKYLAGWDDEDHAAAAAFNVLGILEMEANHKELIDLPTREGKNTFDYRQQEEKDSGCDDECEYELTNLAGEKWGLKNNGDGTNTIYKKKEINWVKEN